MAFELKQSLKLSQQLVMTPQLQMAIKLLQLNQLELQNAITQELKENPTLEETQETADENIADQQVSENSEAEIKEVKFEDNVQQEIDWNNYLGEYNSHGKAQYESEKKDAPEYDSFIALKESLNEHLLWQFSMTSPESASEKIGSFIIGNINKDGYLYDISVEEIADKTHTSVEKVSSVLSLIQTFDPPGVCARNLSECLLLQLDRLMIKNEKINQIVKNHIKHLENKNYKLIAKSLKISIEEVISLVQIIKNLEPKPGRLFSDETPQYINPDIYVHKIDDDFVIVLNNEGMPLLKINPYYKKAVSQKKIIEADTKEYLQEKMRSATWLIKSIHQRQKTIYKVMQSILKFQHDFFEKGISFLKPMILKDVATDIDMHESTISRVTTNKYAYTPQGIFELKYFFNSSIKRSHGENIASASVQEKIKKIIENENSKKPYSDDKISEILKDSNINIARRTVAKYREMIGILSSNKRKQF